MIRNVTATLTIVLCALLALPAMAQDSGRRAEAAYGIDQNALIGAAGRPGDWLSYGRTYKEQRFSPLDQINEENIDELADTRSAPRAPTDRKLPMAIFDKENVDDGSRVTARYTLDADRDGKPEQDRYFDEKTGEIVRKEEDKDYDGSIDIWQEYGAGQVTERKMDTTGDGNVDVGVGFDRMGFGTHFGDVAVGVLLVGHHCGPVDCLLESRWQLDLYLSVANGAVDLGRNVSPFDDLE